jgi:hypothetical protein
MVSGGPPTGGEAAVVPGSVRRMGTAGVLPRLPFRIAVRYYLLSFA